MRRLKAGPATSLHYVNYSRAQGCIRDFVLAKSVCARCVGEVCLCVHGGGECLWSRYLPGGVHFLYVVACLPVSGVI